MYPTMSLILKINPCIPLEIRTKAIKFLALNNVHFVLQCHTEPCYSYLLYQDKEILTLLQGAASALGLVPKEVKHYREWVPQERKDQISSFPWTSNVLYINNPLYLDPDENY